MLRPLVAYINRNAFEANIAHLQSLAPNTELVLMVKANAYGHGVELLLPALGNHRVAVACAEEALELFELGYEGEVILLEGPFSRRCIDALKENAVVFVVHDPAQLDWLEASGFQGKLWLKLDTGMHRLGLQPDHIAACLSRIKSQANWSLETIMMHFASADQPELSSFPRQLDALSAIREQHDLSDFRFSLCNSAGLILHSQCHEHIARPGIALYGANPAPDFSAPNLRRGDQQSSSQGLSAVMSLETAVIGLRDVAPGETVGYGDTWCAQRPSRIATIAVGYGDGYPRHAPNGTPVLVDGHRAEIAGRVSMDMITVDVTDIPEVKVGSVVELWGDQLAIDEVASAVGTIAYELSTSLTRRVPRVLR